MKGISALSSGKVLAYGANNVYILDPAKGTFTYFAANFNFSGAPVYAEQINYAAGYGNSSFVTINLLSGKKTETAFGKINRVSALCYGSQSIFYAVSPGDDESTITALRLEFDGRLTVLNSSAIPGTVASCASAPAGFGRPLFLSNDGIIIPSDAILSSMTTVPVQAVSSNIIFIGDRLYAGASGGLIASFNEDGRVYDTLSLKDNAMQLYAEGTSIIAYGSSGTAYRISKNLTIASSAKIPKGIAIGIYPNGNGYAVLMGDRLVLLDSTLKAIGDFGFSGYMPAFSGGMLLLGRGALVQGTQFPSGCAMSSPEDYSEVGYLPFAVSGNAFSPGGFRVETSVNGGPWKAAAGSTSWKAEIDPTQYSFGLMTIRCRTTSQATNAFIPTLNVYRAQDAQKNAFSVSAPKGMESGKEYAILIYDSLNASVKDFNVSVNNGQNSTITSNRFSFTPSSPGDYTMVFTKEGFEPYTFMANVGGISLALMLTLAAIAILVALYLFFSFYRK
jgi:hypothetical protein